jgi:hypothetical protein
MKQSLLGIVLLGAASIAASRDRLPAGADAGASASAGAKTVAVENLKLHGASDEGNLEGDAVDCNVIIFLSPSHAMDTSRRYPVVYALHSYPIGAEQWMREIHAPQTVKSAFAQWGPRDDRGALGCKEYS